MLLFFIFYLCPETSTVFSSKVQIIPFYEICLRFSKSQHSNRTGLQHYTFSAPRFSGQSLNGSNGSTTSLASNNISFGRQVDIFDYIKWKTNSQTVIFHQVVKSSDNGRYSNGRPYKPLGTNGKHWQNGSLPSMGRLKRD